VTVCVPAGTPVTTARPVVFSERAVRPAMLTSTSGMRMASSFSARPFWFSS
jgi:hypothetical protein